MGREMQTERQRDKTGTGGGERVPLRCCFDRGIPQACLQTQEKTA